MRRIPVVGIIADRNTSGTHAVHSVGEKYIMAVTGGAHALAVALPALGTQQDMAAILSLVDGLLFTGSYSNVEPGHYGGAASAPGTLHDQARDETTLPLMRAAIAASVPVLAICRGLQEMNVAFGGTLHQSVHTAGPFADHREREGDLLGVQYGPAHTILLTPGGQLQQLLKISGEHAAEMMVNSLHAQGIDRLGVGLVVEALAPDGLVEAISVASSPGVDSVFALGVQWHPEWKYSDNRLSTMIFRAFGEACRMRMQARPST
jgi:putative glutamine amidotransferase